MALILIFQHYSENSIKADRKYLIHNIKAQKKKEIFFLLLSLLYLSGSLPEFPDIKFETLQLPQLLFYTFPLFLSNSPFV